MDDCYTMFQSMDWSELKAFVNDIVTVVDASEDVESLEKIKELKVELESILANRETDARKIIAGALP